MDPRHSIHIDQLRGLAILGVLAHHIAAHTGVNLPYLDHYGGLLGVQLFFVLSGYLITDSAMRHPLRHYAWHRVLRIFPAYWVAYLVVGFVGNRIAWSQVEAQPGAFLMNLLNLQQLDPVALIDFDVLSVSWTLTVEVLWYALAPLVVWFGRDRPWSVLAVLLGSAVAWTWLAHTGQLQPLYAARLSEVQRPLQPGQTQVLIQAAFPAQAVHFGWGALLCFYRQAWPRWPAWLPWLFALPLLGLLPLYIALTPFSLLLSGLGMAALMLGVLRLPPLAWAPLVWTGRVSYSIYLLHFPLIVYSLHKFGHLGPAHLLITLGLLAVFAGLMHRWVERPGMALARRIARPPQG